MENDENSDFTKEIITKKVGGNKSSFQIVLPKEWGTLYNLKRGDYVRLKGDKIIYAKNLKK